MPLKASVIHVSIFRSGKKVYKVFCHCVTALRLFLKYSILRIMKIKEQNSLFSATYTHISHISKAQMSEWEQKYKNLHLIGVFGVCVHSQFCNFKWNTVSAKPKQCYCIFMSSVISGSWQIKANWKTTLILKTNTLHVILNICLDLVRG